MADRVQVSIKKPEAKSENKASQTQKTGSYQSINSPAEQILFLQRTIGNQAVGGLIKSGALQAKLRIGQHGDVYEQEADRVADAVIRMPEPQISKETKVYSPTRNTDIQCKCPGCNKGTIIGKEEKEEKLLKKEAPGSTPQITPELESHISTIRGGGMPLPELVRAFYEPRFGHDFGGVRVHTDAKAVEAARAVNARAFTVGKDVVFGEREYVLETMEGRKLLAHELTHVVQTEDEVGKIHRWLTKHHPVPKDYKFFGQTRTIDKGHEDITNIVLMNPEFSSRFKFSKEAIEKIVNRTAYLDEFKETMRNKLKPEDFKKWESLYHGFNESASQKKKLEYIKKAIELFNRGNLAEALDDLGDALHIAQDINSHGFTHPNCKNLKNLREEEQKACSYVQDDPVLNDKGFKNAFRDTWDVLQKFYRGLTPKSKVKLEKYPAS